MSSMAVAELVTISETEPEPGQLAATPRLAVAESPAAAQPSQLRPLAVASCSLCGIARPLGLLVPDGGQACADIRWYCKDARSCTERWTAARPQAGAHTPTVHGSAVAGVEEAAPDEAPAERLGGMLEEAKSAV
jgi:hypothetical protein